MASGAEILFLKMKKDNNFDKALFEKACDQALKKILFSD